MANTSGYQQSLFQSTSYLNDSFSDAILLSGYNTKALGYNHAATREAGEYAETGSQTLWWKWIAPSTGTTRFSLVGSESGVNRITAGSGSAVYDLQGAYSDDRYAWNDVVLNTTAGMTYYVASGADGTAGVTTLLSIIHTPTGGGDSAVLAVSSRHRKLDWEALPSSAAGSSSRKTSKASKSKAR